MSEHVTGIEGQENGHQLMSASEEDVERGSREYERERDVQTAKDVMLRLQERNGRLRGKISAVEDRVQRGLLITGGIGVGGVALLMLILFTVVLPLKGQVAELQASLALLQTGEGQAAEQAAVAAKRSMQRVEADLRQSVQALAADAIAAALHGAIRVDTAGNVDIGTAGSATQVKILGDLIGAVRGPEGQPLRMVMGKTNPHRTNWVLYTPGGVYTDIDTSAAGFSTTPQYFTSLTGELRHNLARGATSIYESTAQGFRVYVRRRGLTPEKAQEWGWSISWIAVGE